MTNTPCIPWAGYINPDGYGMHWSGRSAHRLVMEDHIGRLLDADEELDHRCHTDDPSCTAKSECGHRRCVNVDHLEIVTHAENVARGERARRTHCLHGHKYTPENTYIRRCGARQCRACTNASVRAYNARKRSAA